MQIFENDFLHLLCLLYNIITCYNFNYYYLQCSLKKQSIFYIKNILPCYFRFTSGFWAQPRIRH